MKEIWSMQPRLLHRSGRRAYRVLEHPRFRAAFDFLQMRGESGEVEAELVQWWDRFKDARWRCVALVEQDIQAEPGMLEEAEISPTAPAQMRQLEPAQLAVWIAAAP